MAPASSASPGLSRQESYQHILQVLETTPPPPLQGLLDTHPSPRPLRKATTHLLELLPVPGREDENHRDLLFREVISGVFEDWYGVQDECGEALSAYAHAGAAAKYERGFHDQEFQRSAERAEVDLGVGG